MLYILARIYQSYLHFMLIDCHRNFTVNKNGFTPFANGRCSKSTTVNMNGLTPFANGGCQSLLQSTRMGSHPLLMVDVKVYYSQRVWVHNLC